MRYTTFAAFLLPTLIAAVDFQITHWVCYNGIDTGSGGDNWEQDSVRTGSDSGCSGCTISDDGSGNWDGGNPAEGCALNFNYGPQGDGYTFGVTFQNGVRVGNCYPASGYDVCNQIAYACSIAVLYNCYYA